jgi:nucleoid DNA-binding protein
MEERKPIQTLRDRAKGADYISLLEFVRLISKETGLAQKDVRLFLKGYAVAVQKTLKDGKAIRLQGLTTIFTEKIPARVMYLPKVGISKYVVDENGNKKLDAEGNPIIKPKEEYLFETHIAERKAIRTFPSTLLKNCVNGKTPIGKAVVEEFEED